MSKILYCGLLLLLAGCRHGNDSLQANGTLRLISEISIGEAEGEDPYLFGSIATVAIAEDGSIVVADGKDPRLRIFDSNGAFERDIGREGDGPGEFRRITSVGVWNDNILVFDSQLQKLVQFARDGGLIGSHQFGNYLNVYNSGTVASGYVIAAPMMGDPNDDEARYLRILGADLETNKEFGSLADLYDLEQRIEVQQATFGALKMGTSENRVAVAPTIYDCEILVYKIDTEPIVPIRYKSESCSDRGYRELTESEYEDYSPDNASEVPPGNLSAMFGPSGSSYVLSWRQTKLLLFLDDGSLLAFVGKFDNGWVDYAERFDVNGSHVGNYVISGLPETERNRMVTSDSDGRLYYTFHDSVGAPVLTRYRFELEQD